MSDADFQSRAADVPSYLAGYSGSTVPDFTLNDWEAVQDLAGLAQQILEDPIALAILSDRVYTLLAQEIRLQQERHPTSRRS